MQEDATAMRPAESQANHLQRLMDLLQSLIYKFIASADGAASQHVTSTVQTRTVFDHPSPDELGRRLDLVLPERGQGDHGVVDLARRIFENSVNTWHQGFLDKLYGSTNAVGVISEMILATLNTNVHVYKVAPALTVIEKTVGRELAKLFGFMGSRAGGVSQPGGSSANLTALTVARNRLFPEIKSKGVGKRRLVLFTSSHGHYSFEKAAQVCGIGSEAVRSVPVDEQGCMKPHDLHRMIQDSRVNGETPFFVNATSGTTVLGSFDPLKAIGEVCQQEGLWFHVDASWGGSVAFSEKHRYKLRGAELAQTVTVNPHKMLGVPMTCSFLLSSDITQLHLANTLPAAYLFHTPGGDAASGDQLADDLAVWDLADLTLQCGRRGDALKMALSWVWYGSEGFAKQIDDAFLIAQRLAELVQESDDLVLVSQNPPPCLQVCFYYGQSGNLGSEAETNAQTRRIANRLLKEDFLVDYAPGDVGLLFRVVVSLNTRLETVEALVDKIVQLGRSEHGAYTSN